ncbi:MAG: M48 family metallopeptidase [Myxococcota bacterium]
MPHRRERSRRLAVIGTMLAIGLMVAFIAFPLFSGWVAPLVPNSVVDAVGAEMIKDTAAHGDFCNAPEGRAALQRLTERLATHAPDDDFKIYVSDQEVINAFAAPGGHIVIYRPIITQAEGPEEVAGVLAHEMGHVVEDHPTQGLVEAVGYGIFSKFTIGSENAKQVAQSLLTNHYSRNDELDADRRGVEMLNAVGVDSRGLFSFFERIKSAGEDVPGAVEFMSTHPSGDKRRENLEGVAVAGEAAMSDEDWAALQAICEQTGGAEPIVVEAQD